MAAALVFVYKYVSGRVGELAEAAPALLALSSEFCLDPTRQKERERERSTSESAEKKKKKGEKKGEHGLNAWQE